MAGLTSHHSMTDNTYSFTYNELADYLTRYVDHHTSGELFLKQVSECTRDARKIRTGHVLDLAMSLTQIFDELKDSGIASHVVTTKLSQCLD